MPMNKQSSQAAILSLVNHCLAMLNMDLSYDAASGREIMPCIKIDKPLVVTDFGRKVMK